MTHVLIRPSTPADLAAVTAIYGWNVRHGTGTFELEPPDRPTWRGAATTFSPRACPGSSLEHDGRGARLRLRQPVPAAPGLPLLPRGFGLPRRRRDRPRLRPAAAGRAAGALRGGRRAPDARRHRRLRQRRLDRRAPRARLRPRRHDRGGGLEVRALARRRRHAAAASASAPRRLRHERRAGGRARDARRPSPPGSPCSAAASACTASTCSACATRGPGCIRGRRWSAPTASGACAPGASTTRAAAPWCRCSASCSRRRCCRRSSTA